MGSGVEGIVDGRPVRVGSHQLVYGARKPDAWAVRALRRAAWRSALSVFVAVDGQIVGAVLLPTSSATTHRMPCRLCDLPACRASSW
jgi:cation transport ATPase